VQLRFAKTVLRVYVRVNEISRETDGLIYETQRAIKANAAPIRLSTDPKLTASAGGT